MRRWESVALIVAISGASASQARCADAPITSHVPWLAGTWTCHGATTSATQTYTRGGDGSLSLTNVVHLASGASVEYDDTFHFDTAANRWKWQSVSLEDSGLTQDGTASDWTAGTWTFDGTVRKFQAPERGTINGRITRQDDLRVTYTYLGESSFRRVFAVADGDAWKTVSDTSCTRAPKS